VDRHREAFAQQVFETGLPGTFVRAEGSMESRNKRARRKHGYQNLCKPTGKRSE
jgi:hypothetical protein